MSIVSHWRVHNLFTTVSTSSLSDSTVYVALFRLLSKANILASLWPCSELSPTLLHQRVCHMINNVTIPCPSVSL